MYSSDIWKSFKQISSHRRTLGEIGCSLLDDTVLPHVIISNDALHVLV